MALLLFAVLPLGAQTVGKSPKADLPTPEDIRMISQEKEESKGEWRYLKKNAKIVTSDFTLAADEIDFNSDTSWAYARGHVHLEHFVTGETVDATSAQYNLKSQNGKFFEVSGTAPAKIVASPSVLTTTNPFYFHAAYADRIKTRYILHNGWLTDCSVVKPWWRFQSPIFDVIPGDRAKARNAIFRLHGVPIFYLPYFYRPLGKKDRQSGFLTPNIGHSSLYGYIYGGGYYWAINRSYDMTAIGEYFTQRGPALRYDFRGKPNSVTDFDFNFYGVDDGGYGPKTNPFYKEGGEEFELVARTSILGFTGRLDYNYLSSYLFRQAFSYSITSNVSNQVFSNGFLQRRFQQDRYSLSLVFQRQQLFNNITPVDARADEEILQKLPSVELLTRDQVFGNTKVPVWWSVDASAGALSRLETLRGTTVIDSGVQLRTDLQPRVMTAFQWKGFSVSPSVSLGSTSYGDSYAQNSTAYTPVTACGGYGQCPPSPISNVVLGGAGLFRKNADMTVDFRAPTLERLFTPPKWLHLGEKVKHIIELDSKYEYVTGVNNFQKVIRFDSRDILSDTNQVTISLTNRLYRKNKTGRAVEILRWRVSQARFFDHTFGGAVLPGQRNLVLAEEEFSPFAFLDGPRKSSPVSSVLTVSPNALWNVEWRTDYDPIRSKFVDQSLSGNFRKGRLGLGVAETAVTTSPLLVPQANQLSFSANWGSVNRHGWNSAFYTNFDVLLNRRLFTTVQGSYNTDCCGFAMQLRQVNLGIRNENQYLFSFSVANIGTFGTLSKQTRLF